MDTAPHLPTAELEEWRYSRVGSIDLDRYRPASPTESGTSACRAIGARWERRAATVWLVSGRVVAIEVDPALAARGLVVEEGESDLGVADPDAFVELNAGLATPVTVSMPAGLVLDAPIVVAHVIDAEGVLAAPRLTVHAGDDSQATVIEWSASGPFDSLTLPVTTLRVGPSARLRHIGAQLLDRRTHQIGRFSAEVGQQATLLAAHAALGGSYSRMRFDVDLSGRGAASELEAVYLGDGDQMHDLRTFQHHSARDTRSVLAFKGAVAERAHAVYTALINIHETARGAQAEQSNRILKLSPDAWAESVPNLEINNNDVRCSHASTIGPIDADQRFYLEARGVPPRVADRLIVEGFFADVVRTIADPTVGAAVMSEVSARVEALL